MMADPLPQCSGESQRDPANLSSISVVTGPGVRNERKKKANRRGIAVRRSPHCSSERIDAIGLLNPSCAGFLSLVDAKEHETRSR